MGQWQKFLKTVQAATVGERQERSRALGVAYSFQLQREVGEFLIYSHLAAKNDGSPVCKVHLQLLRTHTHQACTISIAKSSWRSQLGCEARRQEAACSRAAKRGGRQRQWAARSGAATGLNAAQFGHVWPPESKRVKTSAQRCRRTHLLSRQSHWSLLPTACWRHSAAAAAAAAAAGLCTKRLVGCRPTTLAGPRAKRCGQIGCWRARVRGLRRRQCLATLQWRNTR